MVSGKDRSLDDVKAEAAAWLARLNGPYRSEASDRAFRDWVDADPSHEQAFERATAVWEMVAGAAPVRDDSAPPQTRRGVFAMAAALLIAVSAGGLYLIQRPPVYETEIGEQQIVMLKDGTRVSLNTGSSITVRYSEHRRLVSLDHGEAMFEVARNPARPFIVASGDEQVRALGTSFIVRRDEGRTAVTLLEGKVEVTGQLRTARKARIATLSPGERVTVTADAGAALEETSPEIATAWRRGEVVFEDSTLIEVAAEMNRYSQNRLIVADPSLSSLRVSGVFSTSDPREAAQAIALLHGLEVRPDGGNYRLTRS